MLFSPENVIFTLKILVGTVTVLLMSSLIALKMKKPRLHGQINKLFFVLTMTTVIGFELIVRFINPNLTSGFSEEGHRMLRIHLCFSIPAAVLLPAMLYTGVRRMKKAHVPLAVIFLILWTGTAITGIGFLPHTFE